MSKPVYFGITVWGREYCETFADYCLASLLAEGNIPALDNSHGQNLFLICTTKVDWKWFQTHPTFKLLQKYMKTELVDLPVMSEEEYQKLNHPLYSCKLYNVTQGHLKMICRMYNDKVVGGIVYGDTIYAKHALKSAYSYILKGNKAVLFHFSRFARTKMLNHLVSEGYVKSGQALEIRCRELVKIALQHVHVDVLMQQWDSPTLSELIVECAWFLPKKKGVLFHPLSFWYVFIDYSRLLKHNTKSLETNTIDGTYLKDNFKEKDVHLITDSDVFTAISFSPDISRTQLPISDVFLNVNKNPALPGLFLRISEETKRLTPKKTNYVYLGRELSSEEFVVKMAYIKEKISLTLNAQVDTFKMSFTRHPIFLHAEDLTQECYAIEDKAKKVVDEILKPSKLITLEKIFLPFIRSRALKNSNSYFVRKELNVMTYMLIMRKRILVIKALLVLREKETLFQFESIPGRMFILFVSIWMVSKKKLLSTKANKQEGNDFFPIPEKYLRKNDE